MKITILIPLMLLVNMVIGQQVIKVKKMQTIQGVFVLENEDKTKDYLCFDETGYVHLLRGTNKKEKKAIPYLLACAETSNCNDALSLEYTFEKNVVSFTNTRANYIETMEGTFEEGGTKLVFKRTETDQLMVIQEFTRIE